MPSWQSIRFRLSVQYSALVFGLGGALLGLVYLAVQRGLRSDAMMAHLWEGRRVILESGQVVILPSYREVEVRAIESIYNEIVLDRVARFTLLAVGLLFLLSIVVGWVMSGRVLKPVGEITTVAHEIQASDLSRRIGLQGPDDELKRLADTFDEMLERLDTAFSSQRQFLADTSHDLRTPLTVIRSNVELVTDDPEASLDEWRQAGDVIRRNSEKMSKMIQDLLATARLQTGKAESVELDLSRLVAAKVDDFGPVAAERDVAVVGVGSPAGIRGVEIALDRALSNLVENAVKAAPPHSEVLVGSGVVEGWAWLGVADSGAGMGDRPVDRIGLGLAIVTQVADGHGGTLVAHPGRAGTGTAMVMWLPTEAGDGGSPPAESPFTDL
ncbi:MAG TPA: HAMP domain-containing sensor histidine kinase [Acidimicrobiia bacterium]|nr:HAMP domain-containing sensor histidine kinase [Acidimicrobiia bacterium]